MMKLRLWPALVIVRVPLVIVGAFPQPGLPTVVPPPVNVAVTDRAAVMVTMQLPVPVHASLQPANVEPDAAAAVRVTVVPLVMFAEQVDPQLMPPALEVTVPLPVPLLVTVRA